MQRFRKRCMLPLVLCGLFAAGCGGSSRKLESISLSPNPAMTKGGSVQLVATGTFSSAPLTVSPLPVNWNPGSCFNNTNGACPQIVVATPVNVSTTGVASCAQGYSGTVSVEVTAPENPSLSPNATGVPLVTGKTSVVCQ